MDVNNVVTTESSVLFGDAVAFLEKLGAPADQTAAAKQKLLDAEAAILALVEPVVDGVVSDILSKVPGGAIASPFALMFLNGIMAKVGVAKS